MTDTDQVQTPAPYDPSGDIVDLKGADYLQVKFRLKWLRDRHPDAHIETEMTTYDGQSAVFRARVSVPNGGSATGWGSEQYNDFRDFVEKAETKALGRALAALGFGTQFIGDELDGNNGPRIVDSPIERSARQQAPQRSGNVHMNNQPNQVANGAQRPPQRATGASGGVSRGISQNLPSDPRTEWQNRIDAAIKAWSSGFESAWDSLIREANSPGKWALLVRSAPDQNVLNAIANAAYEADAFTDFLAQAVTKRSDELTKGNQQ
jgi:hypothetical protein